MIYREFGNTGIKLSKLGFGAMRLPMCEINSKSVVNEDLAIPLMRAAFDLGVNYIDTAPYYCEHLSEVAVGKALKGYEDKVYLSTKNPIEDASGDNWMKRLEKSLKNLDRDYIDFYHFWGITLEGFNSWLNQEYGPFEAAQKAKEQGLIKHLSFSYHDKPENLAPIVDSGYFESVLIQYNLLDRSNEKNLEYAQSKGLGVVVMGPVGGGRLGSPSPIIQALLENKPDSTAEMALRFVLTNKCVNVALSGMSSIQMVEENAKVASREEYLTDDELAHVKSMMNENKKLAELYCTSCNYCLPCPQGINIPHLFSLMNNHRVYGLTEHARHTYTEVINGRDWVKSASPADCIECGVCESKCPQKLSIIKQLKETHSTLS